MHADHMGIERGDTLDLVPGLILGAVVHKEKLMVDPGLVENPGDGLGGDRDHFFLVIGGENDR